VPTDLPEDLLDGLSYRYIGPVGNRVPAVVGEPGDPDIYYAGSASGGIFKTTDGGANWQPIFDEQQVSSIGALAVAPSDPNVVWAGTGEAFLRANISVGTGVYKSTDRGRTWKAMGLAATGRISRVVIHPSNPDIVYVAALGHCYGPQPERGIFRSQDGGDTWEKILFIDENTGASDLVMDPNNPRILLAGMWQIRLWTAGRESGGPGSGLHISRDGGDTWDSLEEEGLPEKPWGKVALGMSAADSDRIYALIETSSNADFAPFDEFQGVLWRSDDGGKGWEVVSHDNNLAQRPLYYSRVVAAPNDADEVHFMAVRHSLSKDGGRSSESLDSGWDRHDLWIDPRDPDRMIVGHDGGVSISTNHGKSWLKPLLPNAQMYHVHVDEQIPYFVYGNRQDGPSTHGPSNSLRGETIPIGAWSSVGGCEVGMAVPVPGAGTVWTGCFDGILSHHDLATGLSRDVSVWPVAVESWAAEKLKYRWQWAYPIALSPHDPNRVYVGSQYVHSSTNGGESWNIISPDLTTDDPDLQRRTGGLTLDDAGPSIVPTVFALAESPLEAGVLWAGTNDGQVQISRDSGATWTNLTANLKGLPPLGTVSNLEPSRHAPGTCYLTVDRHQENDPEPYVYKTTDYGATWQRIDSDLPRGVLAYAHCVREDPVRPGLLYLGTENALHLSFDDGAHWHSLQSNLPPAPVHWLTVQEHFNDLVVATYGRGFWILDDLTPLQQLSQEDLDGESSLFKPRPAYRFRQREEPFRHLVDAAAGSNPEYGASLTYALKEETESLEMRILDSAGAVIRTLEDLPTKAGLHRIHWDLRHDRTPEVKLRTRPPKHPKVTIPVAEGFRELPGGWRPALPAVPGEYTIELTVDEQTLSQPLVVLKDPGSRGSAEDIALQTPYLFGLKDLIERSVELINSIEWLRKQLDDLQERLADIEETDELTKAAEALDESLQDIENQFFDLRLTGASQDSLRWQRKLYDNLLFLAAGIGGTDLPPTDQQIEVYNMLEAEVASHEQGLKDIRQGEMLDFENLLRQRGTPYLIEDGFQPRPAEDLTESSDAEESDTE
jgi:photosystem II stability/assembly factor-like uncharacterized protein